MQLRFPNTIMIKPVHTSSNAQEATPALVQLPSPDDAAEYAAVAAYWTKQSAKGVAALYVGKKVVDTAQQIVVLVATAKLTK